MQGLYSGGSQKRDKRALEDTALEEATRQLESSSAHVLERVASVAKVQHPGDRHQLAKVSDCLKELYKVDIAIRKAGSPRLLLLQFSPMCCDLALAMLQCALPSDKAETVAAAFCTSNFSLDDLSDLYKHAAWKQNKGHIPYKVVPQLVEWLELTPPKIKPVDENMDVDH